MSTLMEVVVDYSEIRTISHLRIKVPRKSLHQWTCKFLRLPWFRCAQDVVRYVRTQTLFAVIPTVSIVALYKIPIE